ncbi:hypothetical protein, partial [Streptomyces hainanensis]|uniref:hypothetical protein n=1 Tax=Streptomyces hainanensis TaxID=402648 RepID=UPI001A9ED785
MKFFVMILNSSKDEQGDVRAAFEQAGGRAPFRERNAASRRAGPVASPGSRGSPGRAPVSSATRSAAA